MAAVFHRQTEPYSSHEAGDSIYDHSGEKVKTSVLGFAIALTLGFSAIELVAGWLGNSLALVGDAGHMVTDSMSLLFALVANIFSRHGADEDHSFGHGRLEALAAFVNGIVMSGVIVWIVIEAGKRMMNPEPVSGGSVMMVATTIQPGGTNNNNAGRSGSLQHILYRRPLRQSLTCCKGALREPACHQPVHAQVRVHAGLHSLYPHQPWHNPDKRGTYALQLCR